MIGDSLVAIVPRTDNLIQAAFFSSAFKIRPLQGMEDLVRKGLCKAIGISNFSSIKVKNLLETAEIVPATNQGDVQNFRSRIS